MGFYPYPSIIERDTVPLLTSNTMKPREGKTGKGTHSYAGTEYAFTRMGDDRWYVFFAGKDTGHDFKTLKEAREWASKQPNAR